MVLTDFLKTIEPDSVIYIGYRDVKRKNERKQETKKNYDMSSGFVYIGYAKDAPVDVYGKEIVTSTYQHIVDIPGLTITLKPRTMPKTQTYWFWHEIDPTKKRTDSAYYSDTSMFENLLIGIAKQAVNDYQTALRSRLKVAHIKTESGLERIISVCRKAADLDFLSASGTGQNLITAAEDDIRIDFRHPEIKKIVDTKKKAAKYQKALHELHTERVKAEAKTRYATIKGKSVNHDL